MAFGDDIKALADRSRTLRPQLQTEEAVKHALVMPFLQALGYNVFDPTEVMPEFTADVGIKKGEKVDYAIFMKGEPHILIEVKALNCDIAAHSGQLYRYFSVTKAKFGILTNGLCYQFFSDLDEPNKMDSKPFLIFDLDNPRDQSVQELEKFHKKHYDVSIILSTAAELKYTNQIKEFLSRQFKDPSDDLIRLIVKNVYDGKITQQTMLKFEPLTRRSIALFISDLVSEKLKSALQETEKDVIAQAEAPMDMDTKTPQKDIVTTEEEIEGFVMIRMMMRDLLGADHFLSYKDTLSYFGILLDNNTRKWICRLFISSSQRSLHFRDGEKVTLDSMQDIEKYKDKLSSIVQNLIGGPE